MEDLISKMPDDILVSIITRIPTKRAVGTSILSKRWRDVYKSVSTIKLCCGDLVACPSLQQPHHHHLDPFPIHDPNLILHRLHSFLQLHDPTTHPLRSFTSCSSLSKLHRRAFEKCIYSLAKLGTEKISLSFCCKSRRSDMPFSCHLLSHMPSLQHFRLLFCSLLKSRISKTLRSCYNYPLIKTMILFQVKLYPGSLECVFSNCPSLVLVGILYCEFAHCKKLCLRGGPDHRLKYLLVKFCVGVEEIELHASNLVALEFFNTRMVNFIFCHVPQLQSVYLYLSNENVMSYACGEKGLPTRLTTLVLAVDDDEFEQNMMSSIVVPPKWNANVFNYLKQLELSLCCTRRINLLALTPLLHSCPLLQEFHLTTLQLLTDYKGPQVEGRVILHTQLKKVYISGFGGTRNEIDFTSYIMKSAIMLQNMRISTHASHYLGNDTWVDRVKPLLRRKTCRRIRNMLRRQAVSKTVDVAIRLSSCIKREKVMSEDEYLQFCFC